MATHKYNCNKREGKRLKYALYETAISGDWKKQRIQGNLLLLPNEGEKPTEEDIDR